MQPFIFNNDYDEDEDYFLDLHAHHVSSKSPLPTHLLERYPSHSSLCLFFLQGMHEQDMDLDPREMDPTTRRAVTVRKVFGELWHWKEQVRRHGCTKGATVVFSQWRV